MMGSRVLSFARHAIRPIVTSAGVKMPSPVSGLFFSAARRRYGGVGRDAHLASRYLEDNSSKCRQREIDAHEMRIIGGVNLAGFAITAQTKTHKITDLTGSGAFVLSVVACAWKSGSLKSGAVRPMLLNVAVGIWGIRLASYLFARILKTGEDERLAPFFPGKDEGWLDTSRSFFPVNLAGFWTIQAMWAWVVTLPVTLTNFSPMGGVPMGLGGWACMGIFAAGLAIEAIADYQKFVFKNDIKNKGKFIDTGLWALSRHPNYLGELVIWWSLLGVAVPALRGAGQLGLGVSSPVFITSLIMYVSGVPLLETQHDQKYGADPRYQEYKKKTPLLVPDVSKLFFW